MNKYEFFDEGDFWGITKNGDHLDGDEVVDDIQALQAELDAANANIANLNSAMADMSKSLAQNLNGIKAQAVTDLISECSYSGVIDGVATSIIDVDSAIKYADRLEEGS